MKKVLKNVLKLTKKNNWVFGQVLDYIKQFKKYDNITYRDLDRMFDQIKK